MRHRTLEINPQRVREFRRAVWTFYRKHRRSFPWRETRDPYRIVVSELMLQQTQTARVQKFYERFLLHFPDITALSEAPLAAVLKEWQGLGYNRRAKFLWYFARHVTASLDGQIPSETEDLLTLPGIGRYTARAIRVFAFGKPEVLVETNTRAVVMHHFFREQLKVTDKDIEAVLTASLSRRKPREWNYALMDYGAYLKRTDRTLTRKSSAFRVQSRFAGSPRQLRGRILRELTKRSPLSLGALVKSCERSKVDVAARLQELVDEELVHRVGAARYALGSSR